MKPITKLEWKVAVTLMLGASLVETAQALGCCRSRIEALKWRGLDKLKRGSVFLVAEPAPASGASRLVRKHAVLPSSDL